MDWPPNWYPIEDLAHKAVLESELMRELKPGHVLFGIPAVTLGGRNDRDDVLFELRDGTRRVAAIHLTWAGEKERPPWPDSELFENFADWAEWSKENDI